MIRLVRHRRLIPSALIGVAALAFAATSPVVWGEDHDDGEIPFDDAELFFELNNTDGDLGIHALIDGEGWKRLVIEDPRERKMLDVRVKGRMRRQGLTEIFFESAEPTFDELDPEDFFRRFPAGIYEIEGRTLDGEELESETEVTHTMPAPPQPTVNDEPFATVCDPDDPDYDATEVAPPVTIAWPAVTLSHPDPLGGGAGVQDQIAVVINNYQVVVEAEDGELSIILPPGETSFEVPLAFTALGDTFKYEVLAREESYNQTATESCFVLE